MTNDAIVALAASFLAACLGTFASRAFARQFGIVSMPNPIVSQHVTPIAYLGGIGVSLGVAVGMLSKFVFTVGVFLPPPADWRWDILIGLPAFLAIGLADDLRPFTPLRKLLLQVAAATLVAAIDIASGSGWTVMAEIVIIVVLVNAINVVDVSDGLAGGVALVSALTFVGLENADLAIAVVGACFGFLVFNAPPASIFLGDAGTHVLGFLLASLTFGAWSQAPTLETGAIVALANGVALFEVAFLIVVRRAQGKPWWRGSPDHISLRLQACGFTPWMTNWVIWSSGAMLAALAVLTRRGAAPVAAVVAITLFGAAFAWRWLLSAPQPESR